MTNKVSDKKKRMEAIKSDEKKRMEAIKAASVAPSTVGDDILCISPARGAVEAFQPLVRMPDGTTGFKYVRHGYRGRDAMRERDVFDVMRDQTKRHKKPFPLSDGQVGTARYFRALHERVNGSGYKLSTLEQTGGSGGSGSFMDWYLRLKQNYDRMTAAIGRDLVLDARNVADKYPPRSIDERNIVFDICIGQCTPSKLLKIYGWKNTTRRRQKIIEALACKLDDIAGVSCY